MPEKQTKRWDWRQVMRRRWVWWFTGVVLVFILALVLTPYGLGYGLRRAMLEQGLEEVELEDLDFNPFTGRLTVEDLQGSAGGRVLFRLPEGSLDLGWFPLLRNRVYIEQVTLKGAEIVLAEQESARFLLIDDAKGRRVALARGVPVVGVAGSLLAAKSAGILAAVRPLLEQLSQVGYRLSPRLTEAVLARARE